MNSNQKRVLIAALIVIAGMIAYPPFHFIGINGVVINMGYGWIFAPPEYSGLKATVDVLMLLMQWIGILATGGLAFILTKTPAGVFQSSSVVAAEQSELERQEPAATLTGKSVTASNQRPGFAAYVLHFFAMALAVPIVKLGGLGGAIPIVIGCALAFLLSTIVVNRIYALGIRQRTRTIVLWLLPVAYFLTYALIYYIFWTSHGSADA